MASLGHVAIGLAARRFQVEAPGLSLLPSAGLGVVLAEALLFLPVFGYAFWPRRSVRAR